MSTVSTLSFEHAGMAAQLAALDDDALDTLDFGVIGFDAETLVRRYNAFESKAAGLTPERVLGQPLFTIVAPCMNNFLVAQRYEDAQVDGAVLDMTINYVLTLRMRPTKVVLRLLAGPADQLRYLLVTFL